MYRLYCILSTLSIIMINQNKIIVNKNKRAKNFKCSCMEGLGQEHLPFFFFKNRRLTREADKADGQKGRGLGGRNFCPSAPKTKPRRPARSEQNPAQKFSFPFRRKKSARANQKM